MSRRLRIFMTAFLGARIAEWVYLVALNWAVLQSTDSALYLAVVNACRLLPGLVLSYPAGVLADRFERLRLYRRLTFLVSVMTPVVGLCLLWRAPFWVLAGLLILRESLACMDPPIRQALLVDLAGRTELSKALAWSATTMNLGRLLGPALGGVLVSQTPIIVPFLVAAGLTATQAVGLGRRLQGTPRSAGTNQGVWSLLRTHPELRSLILLTLPAMLFGFPYTAMMPLFARDLHHQGADGLGLYLSLAAAGALLGSLWQTREGGRPN
ncbi:MAG: MFS transporter, partial [Candidatus Eremiobacteraeota bacterium]|nr:MFS transporter [Candidatus Eremiobacteraeota bacterium]